MKLIENLELLVGNLSVLDTAKLSSCPSSQARLQVMQGRAVHSLGAGTAALRLRVRGIVSPVSIWVPLHAARGAAAYGMHAAGSAGAVGLSAVAHLGAPIKHGAAQVTACSWAFTCLCLHSCLR